MAEFGKKRLEKAGLECVCVCVCVCVSVCLCVCLCMRVRVYVTRGNDASNKSVYVNSACFDVGCFSLIMKYTSQGLTCQMSSSDPSSCCKQLKSCVDLQETTSLCLS